MLVVVWFCSFVLDPESSSKKNLDYYAAVTFYLPQVPPSGIDAKFSKPRLGYIARTACSLSPRFRAVMKHRSCPVMVWLELLQAHRLPQLHLQGAAHILAASC
jgi:hypothetical protein